MTKELADAARSYLTAGLTVIALTGKLPNKMFHEHWNEDHLSGVPEGPDDDALIDRVFTHPTTSGVGIVLTHGTVVVDIDGETGAESFREIMGDAPWQDQWGVTAAKTGRGMHLFYYSEHGHRNTVLAPKLDLKGEGGYVAAPPSRHPDGHRYEWLNSIVEPESGQRVVLGFLPEPIERKLARRARLAEAQVFTVVRNIPAVKRLNEHGRPVLAGIVAPKTLDGLVKALQNAAEGNGNNLLHWAACSAAEDGFTIQEASAAFLPVVTKEWERPMREHVARGTIRSGYRTVLGQRDG